MASTTITENKNNIFSATPPISSLSARNPCFDIIRCFALFCVISVHFFLNNEFYSEPVAHKRMIVMVFMRCAFMVCVPTFLVLTGCLMKSKKLSKRYYSKCIKTICIYCLSSIACLIYKKFYLNDPVDFLNGIFAILGFSAAPYSWYVQMYLGLFIMIPFLNLIYNNLPSKKAKFVLIATFFVLTSLPSIINVYDIFSPTWWKNPASSTAYLKLIPAWWTGIYPLTYYFIGCYLIEYKPKMNIWKNILLIILTLLVYGTYCIWRSYNVPFASGAWEAWGSPFNVVLTVLVFIFFFNRDYRNIPHLISRVFAVLSDCCLGGYLVSWIFDSAFYPILNLKISEMPKRLEYYFIIVPVIYLCSLTLSFVINLIYSAGKRVCTLCIHRKSA